MGSVICFANMKGGVGKTTLCVNLAFQLFTEFNKKVLVVDNDPQFNATSAFLRPDDYIRICIKKRENHTIYEVYEKPPRIRGAKTAKIDPSKFFLNIWYFTPNPDIVLDLIPSRIELYETLRNPSQKEYLLEKLLSKHATKYDYILIDCPPTPSVLTLSAFTASDYALIPVTPDYYATMGLPQFLGTLNDFKENLHDPHNITPLGVVFTNVDRRMTQNTRKSMERVTETLSEFPALNIPVFHTKMSHLKIYEKSLWQSVPVQRIRGKGIRGKGLAIAELSNIAAELQQNIAIRNAAGNK